MSLSTPGRAVLATLLVVGVATQLAVGMRASRTASVTGDEPFYLLTTQSLRTDGDLDLNDEYADHEEARFWDGTVPLWRQMQPTAEGQLLAPHDPGLSLLTLPAYALGGLEGTRRFLALLWALAAALSVLLAIRSGAPAWAAGVAGVAVGAGAPGIVYASQVYPEAPAALAVVVGLLLAGAERPRPVAMAAAVIALPWLGFKYIGLAVLLAGAFVLRHRHRRRRRQAVSVRQPLAVRQPVLATFAVLTAVAAVHYVWWHFHTFGGLTPYATNVVYSGEGSARILADHLGPGGRSYRLYGLFLDARFGLFRWLPLAVLAPVGIGVSGLRHRGHNVVAALTVAATVLAGTFASITMMGWWFPGRMLIAGLPALTVFVAHGASRLPRTAVVLAAWSLAIGGATAWGAHHGVIRLAVDPFALGAPLPPHWLFPDFRHFGPAQIGASAAWAAALVVGRSIAGHGQALAPRRQLARLPRLLRPAD
ncbi:MAG: hypothetical protein QOK43_513 [Acidimicrobiaceae bacterium]|nr:hypothetical protein [Acidimicrobiaceae bacterium]